MIHDIIKINYVREGFLPDYPPHLISDKEMLDAFILDENRESGVYFDYMYPDSFESLSKQYQDLKSDIILKLDTYLSDGTQIPNWIYSYMLGSVIGINSSTRNKHDILVLLNEDNVDDEFTEAAAAKCYDISKDWIAKLAIARAQNRDGVSISEWDRVPSLFGEPGIIKSLRLQQASILR